MDIQRILEDFKGIRKTRESNPQGSTHHNDKNEKGECITSRNGIADVFGEFYKKLYEDNDQDESEQKLSEDENKSSINVHYNNTEETTRIPEITIEELQIAINKLRRGKSPGSNGIRAEDIKACDDEAREMLR